MSTLLTAHDRRYPSWNEQDLYKLLYQGAMGNEHAISDVEAVRRWLASELNSMGQGPAEPLIDPISADGAVLRVHLRPMAAAGLEAAGLLDAFLTSPSVFKGSRQGLVESMEAALALAETGQLSIPVDNLRSFFAKMRKEGLPAVHHSTTYERLYRPAYRVVMKICLPSSFQANV